MNIKTIFAGGIPFSVFAFVLQIAAANNPLDFPEYTQSVTVTFASPDDAANARMTLAALPDGASRSFGTRWDDTTTTHIPKADMLESIGVKGGFYITAASGTNGTPQSFRYAGVRSLVERGHAVGNHTMTHPFIVDLSPEAIFEEILMARILLERDTGHSVVSYASPYGWYGSRWLDRSVSTLAVKMVNECGMWVSADNPMSRLGIPEDVWYPAHRFSADDRNPDRKKFMDGFKAQTAIADRSPLSPRITLGTHSWCDAAGNALQAKWLKEKCVRPDWAQMNDYEYGAYRYSVINGTVKRTAVSGSKATFVVRRFCPAALGDDLPLSVSFSPAPLSVTCGGKPLEKRAGETWRLPHDASRKPVDKVGLAEADGKCAKIPGVETVIRPDTASRKVTVSISNKTGSPLDDIYGVVHLPPEFKRRRRTFRIATVPAGETAERTFDCGAAEPTVHPYGKALYAASVDFSRKNSRERIWSTVSAQKTGGILLPSDAVKLTPIVPVTALDNDVLRSISAGTGALKPIGDVRWASRASTAQDAWYLVTPRSGRMNESEAAIAKEGGARAIALQFRAREDGIVTLFTNARSKLVKLYLNGAEITHSGGKADLPARAGTNRLVLKIPVASGKYTAAVQLAVCEDGRIGSPCECIPFSAE